MNPDHLHFTLRFIARLALAVALIGTAAAQTLTGALGGRVSNSTSGQSLQGAIVRVVGTELRADTARDGSYDLRALPAGRYEVEASYFGLDTKRASVEIVAGRPASLNFLLGSDAVQLEAVKVEAAVLIVERFVLAALRDRRFSPSPNVSVVPAPFVPRPPDQPRFPALATAGWRRERSRRTGAWRTGARAAGPAGAGARRVRPRSSRSCVNLARR
jgi:hypothetical protein